MLGEVDVQTALCTAYLSCSSMPEGVMVASRMRAICRTNLSKGLRPTPPSPCKLWDAPVPYRGHAVSMQGATWKADACLRDHRRHRMSSAQGMLTWHSRLFVQPSMQQVAEGMLLTGKTLQVQQSKHKSEKALRSIHKTESISWPHHSEGFSAGTH